MAHLTVKIYNHTKRPNGRWTFIPVDISLDTRSTKSVTGNFKISWYQGGKKQFSKGHLLHLHEAVRAGKQKQLELHDAMDGVQPAASEPGRVPIDLAADAYLRTTKLNGRPGTYKLAEFDLKEFQEWNATNAKRIFVDQITRDDMLEFRNMIVKSGREARTACNKTMRVNHYICKTLNLKPGDGPIKQVDCEKTNRSQGGQRCRVLQRRGTGEILRPVRRSVAPDFHYILRVGLQERRA
jgi:hypothetical protein